MNTKELDEKRSAELLAIGLERVAVLGFADLPVVRVAHDHEDDTYSIGLEFQRGVEIKMISKELYEMLIKELVGVKPQRQFY